jgi:hypothetical protein
MLFSTTYLRSRVFLSIKSPFFMFLRFNGSNKLPQKGLLGSVGLRTVAPATPLNREVLPSSYPRPKIEPRQGFGIFSKTTSREGTGVNTFKNYEEKRGMSIISKHGRISSLPGAKKEGYHDHDGEVIGGFKEHVIDGYNIPVNYKEVIYTATSSKMVPLNGAWHKCTLISSGKNLDGQVKDQYALGVGQLIKSSDTFVPKTAKEPLVQVLLSKHAINNAENEQNVELLEEAMKIRKTLP